MDAYDIGGTARVYVLSGEEVEGMKECIRDQGNRIAELEADVENYREREEGSQRCIADLGEQLAQQTAEADLFHAAYVGMCTMHPNRATSIGYSQQEP